MQSITTSIRIKPYLRQELQTLSAHSGQGMNRIIECALDEYLQRHRTSLLIEEALKDIAFLQHKNNEDSFWDAAYDDSGWVA